MGCAKGDDANATAKGGAVASEGRCDPVAGCTARSSISAVVASPTRVDPASRVPRPALRVATAQGGAVSSTGRCDPEAECRRPPTMRSRHPRRCPIPAPQRPSADALGPPPFARSLTRQTACKATSHPGCGKIGRLWHCAPWHRSPSYDQRRAPYDHPDFNSNALREDLFSSSLSVLPICCNPEISAARKRTAIDRRGR